MRNISVEKDGRISCAQEAAWPATEGACGRERAYLCGNIGRIGNNFERNRVVRSRPRRNACTKAPRAAPVESRSAATKTHWSSARYRGCFVSANQTKPNLKLKPIPKPTWMHRTRPACAAAANGRPPARLRAPTPKVRARTRTRPRGRAWKRRRPPLRHCAAHV
ncbi:hypothetical protein BC830DRAFT_541839 [Chytriomyces sp. MP71]|nr:hypothetical protein BC830DRAFT_541839 [Chytriomyces sp. MP71]